MHQSECLAGFPTAEEAINIDLVLGLSENADVRSTPIRVTPNSSINENLFSFRSEMVIVIKSYATLEQHWVERDWLSGNFQGVAVRFKQELAQKLIGWGYVRNAFFCKSQALGDAELQQGVIARRVMIRRNKRRR